MKKLIFSCQKKLRNDLACFSLRMQNRWTQISLSSRFYTMVYAYENWQQ